MLTPSPNSRQSLKKYVKANNNITTTDNMFDSLFNKALKSGVEKGVFEQPKGECRIPNTIGPRHAQHLALSLDHGIISSFAC